MIYKIESDEVWDQHKNHYIHYTEDGKRIIASVRLQTQLDDEYAPQIQSLYVQPDYRGMGYSKKLLQDSLDFFKAEGEKEIELMVRKDNFIKKMYEGFEWMTLIIE